MPRYLISKIPISMQHLLINFDIVFLYKITRTINHIVLISSLKIFNFQFMSFIGIRYSTVYQYISVGC